MEKNWGVGNKKDNDSFDIIKVGNEDVELIFGEHPHSRQDNNIYARYKDGKIKGFSGHRKLFKIEIEEYNYLKQSELSGDEIRKGGCVKLYCNGICCFEEFVRSYERGYEIVNRFIDDMEMNWNWYPNKLQKQIGKIIGYHEQLFKIRSFIVSQGCMMLETLDGTPRKKFLWEDNDDYDVDKNEDIKVSITGKDITWHPRIK